MKEACHEEGLSVSLPEKMARDLEVAARETGRNKSDIVKESLAIYLWEDRFNRMRKALKPGAKAGGFVTDEDVFKAIS